MGKPDPNWVPRPAVPYEPGNVEAYKHGAFSERIVSADAAEMIESMMETLPWLQTCDAIVLDTLVRSVARWRRIDDRITELEVDEVPDKLWQQVDREQRHIVTAAGKLGMTATDRATLMKDASWAKALTARTLGSLESKGAEIRAQRLAGLPAGEGTLPK